MSMDAKKRRQQRINQLVPSHQSWQEWRIKPPRNRLLIKCVYCLMLYVLIWTIFQIDDNSYAQKAQRVIRAAMSNSFDYETMSEWYRMHIGNVPALLPLFEGSTEHHIGAEFGRPVIGRSDKILTNQSGIMEIHTASNDAVISIGRGLVQLVAPSRNDEKTVKILYSNGIQAIYGGLKSSAVEKNDWLEEGTLIGHADILFFALKKGDQYVNPRDVISFD